MEITRQKIEAYLDDLVVRIYISEGKSEDLEKLNKALNSLEIGGYDIRKYRETEKELNDEYRR